MYLQKEIKAQDGKDGNNMVDKGRLDAVVDKLLRYNYWFCNEMMKEEANVKKFQKACKEAEKSCEMVCIASTAPGNLACMKGCMEDTVKLINFLRNKEEQENIEPWQLAGAEAILKQCKEDGVIPFDLPASPMAVFGMWTELEQEFKRE